MTIYDELKADHDHHRELLSAISGGEGDRAALFEQLRVDISAHAAAEEQTLYATMLADPELQEDARHAVSEHKEVEDMLTELFGMDATSDGWMAKFEAMQKRYLHHIDEEEAEMFVEAEEALPEDIEDRLAERFETRKEAELEKAATTDPTEKEHKE